ncbi:hypothetical protein D3C84_789060 [compost metagenome]
MPRLWDDDYEEQVMRSNYNEMNYRDRAYYDAVKQMRYEQEQEDYIRQLEEENKALRKRSNNRFI